MSRFFFKNFPQIVWLVTHLWPPPPKTVTSFMDIPLKYDVIGEKKWLDISQAQSRNDGFWFVADEMVDIVTPLVFGPSSSIGLRAIKPKYVLEWQHNKLSNNIQHVFWKSLFHRFCSSHFMQLFDQFDKCFLSSSTAQSIFHFWFSKQQITEHFWWNRLIVEFFGYGYSPLFHFNINSGSQTFCLKSMLKFGCGTITLKVHDLLE